MGRCNSQLRSRSFIVLAIAIRLFAPWPAERDVVLATPPYIAQQPTDQAVCVGSGTGNVYLYCYAGGTLPISYQWRRGTTNLINGDNIHQANYNEMYIYPVRLSDSAMDYNCLVTNAEGSAVTNYVAVTVWPTGTGDVNGDGAVNGADVQAFMNALFSSPPPYTQRTASFCAADMNGNGDLSLGCDDLCVFVQTLLEGPIDCGLPPENDECPNATQIFTGVRNDGSTAYATRDGPHINCDQGCSPACDTAPDVWYKWVADFTGTADFTMCDNYLSYAQYDSVLAIYDACPSMGGVQLACDDDTHCQGLQSRVSQICIPVNAGHTYWICVSGWAGNRGCFSLRISPGGCN